MNIPNLNCCETPLYGHDTCNVDMYVQCWYTDDSACAGKLSQIRLWLDKLIQLGPAYGYFAEPTKSALVVAPQFADVAKNCFKDLGITVSSGHRFLGGVIGTR